MSDEPPRRIRLALLFGGRSPEHDVSVISAQSVTQALDPARFDVLPMAIGRDGRWLALEQSRALLSADTADAAEFERPAAGTSLVPAATLTGAIDVAFPLLHGPFGEDGTVQGLLELLDVPYVGSGVAASAVGMDKALMKALFLQQDLPVLPHATIRAHHWQHDREAILQRLALKPGLPCFVKPANMGSSIGISKVETPAQLAPALDIAFAYDLKALVEHGVPGYREIECAVLGNEMPEVSVPGEIIVDAAFYDYETKYTDGAAGLRVPADVQPETERRLRRLAQAAFAAIDASGMARVDFLVAPDESEIWLNEINTIPGFTPYSMYPLLWQASGISYPELIARLVELALERHDARSALRRDRLAD
jgi:D-alanine-D-alanine ligase